MGGVYRTLDVIGIDGYMYTFLLDCTFDYAAVCSREGKEGADNYFIGGMFGIDQIRNKKDSYFLYNYLKSTEGLKELLDFGSDLYFKVVYLN